MPPAIAPPQTSHSQAIDSVSFGHHKPPVPPVYELTPLWTAEAVSTEFRKQGVQLPAGFTPDTPKSARFEAVFALLEKLPRARNPLEAWLQYCQVLQLEEDHVFGQAFHANRIYAPYPRTFYRADDLPGNVLVCRDKQNLFFFGPNGAYEVWRRYPEDAFELNRHVLTQKRYQRVGADGEPLAEVAELLAGQVIQLQAQERPLPWDQQKTPFNQIRAFADTFYPAINAGDIKETVLVEETEFHRPLRQGDFNLLRNLLMIFPLDGSQLTTFSLVLELIGRVYSAAGAARCLLNPLLLPSNNLYLSQNDDLILYSPAVPGIFVMGNDGSLALWLDNDYLKTGKTGTRVETAPPRRLDMADYTRWFEMKP